MLLVELANEYELTTADAIDICVAAGIPADSSAAVLDAKQVDRWREYAAVHDIRQPAGVATVESAAGEGGPDRTDPFTGRPPDEPPPGDGPTGTDTTSDSSFGPMPPAPWETDAPPEAVVAAPTSSPNPQDAVDAQWGVSTATEPHRQVSLYAAAALALSLVTLIFPFLAAVVSIPLALYARKQIARSRGALSGDRLATAALVVSGIGIALWLGIVGVSMVRDQQARDRRLNPPDIQVNTREIGWDEIGAGDCVRIPHADLDVERWQGVSCDAPHEGEVFARLELLDRPSAYPGNVPVTAFARDECVARFTDYVGRPFDASELQIGVFFPTRRNWVEQGDRSFGCIVYQEDYRLINGTLRGADR